MRRRSRLLAWLLTAAMCLSLVPVTALAVEEDTIASWTIANAQTKEGVFAGSISDITCDAGSPLYTSTNGKRYGANSGWEQGKGFYFDTPTTGYGNITVSGTLYASNTGPGSIQLEGKIGGEWVALGENITCTGGNTKQFTVAVSRSELSDLAKAEFRLIVDTDKACNGNDIGSSGTLYIDTNLIITGVSTAPETKVKTPTATPGSGTVLPNTTVSLSCSTDGATIQYRQTALANESDWTQSNTIQLPTEENTYTYEVKATKEGLEDSDVVPLTYTVKTQTVVGIGDALNASSGEFTVKGVVTLVDGRNIYIQDATGGICAYFGSAPSGIVLGDTIIVTGSRTEYGGLPELEITGTEHQKVEDEKIILTAKTKAISAITTADDLCTYVKVENAKVTAISGTSVTIEDSTGSIQIYKTVMPDGLAVDDTVTVSAAVGIYSSKPQLRNTKAEEIKITEKGSTDPGTTDPTEPGENNSVWTKTTLETIKSTDKVAITMTKDSVTYVMPNGVVAGQLGGKDQPLAVVAQISGSQLLTDGSSAKFSWTITSASGGYHIKAGDSYLYTIADNNGMRIGSTEAVWSLNTNGTHLMAKDTSGVDRYLGIQASTDWRAYTSVNNTISGQQVNFWTLTTEGKDTEPDEPEVPTEPVDPGYKPASGDKVVIFYPADSKVMTGTANGTRLKGANATPSGDVLYTDGTHLVLNVSVQTDNGDVYIFTTSDGKVLNTGTTGNSLTLVDTSAVTASKWKLEEDTVNGGWRIMSTEANYNGNYNQGIEYYSGNFTTYGYKTGDKIFTMRFYKVEDCKPEPQTDSDVVDTIAQWGGGGPYDNTTHATEIKGDLFKTGDMLDANATFTVQANGAAARPYQQTAGSGSTPESPNYNYYMGGENIGAKEGDYMQFALSTKGYGDMELSFRLRVTNTGAKEYTLKYSADGGTSFSDFEKGSYSYAYTSYPGGVSTPVSGSGTISNGVASIVVGGEYIEYTFTVPVGAENVDNLLIRLVPGTTRVSGTGAISGNVRIDSVVLTGSPIINDDSIVGYVAVDPDGREEDVPGGTKLAMTSSTSGATIKYRFVKIDSSDLSSAAWSTYSGNVTLPTELPVALEVYAESGGNKSMTRRFVYNAGTVETVRMDPNGGGVYLEGGKGKIVLTCNTADATIWYRTNKMTTDSDGNGEIDYVEYTGPIELAKGFGELTVEAYATADGLADSAVTTRTFTERAQDKYNLYFGQMHSHTSYSDGAGTAEDAFSSVAALSQEQWNMDFLSVTDHSNSFDDAGGSKTINDAPTGSEWNEGKALAKQYTTGQFVGIFGYEMTWSNGLGHINTFNTTGYQDRTQSSYTTYSTALQNYYAMLKIAPASISQFNHPGTTFGDFSDFSHYDEEIDQLITLIEVGNGEGAIGSSGYFPSYEYYTRALDKGWHVAPTNNQDNHKGGWGTANTGRDVVLVDELTEEAIYDAMRNYRVYATEDLNLEIYYTFDGNIMGSILDENSYSAGEMAKIKLELNDPDDATATVEVIVNGGLSLKKVENVSLKNNTIEIEVPTTYNYYYIKLTQGDKDIAVTAPVWIGSVEAVGVSSFSAQEPLTITGESQTFDLELYNNEKKDFAVTSIEYTIKETGTKIGASTDITVVKKMGTANTSFSYTFDKDGIFTVTATVKGTLDGMVKTYTQDLEVTVMPAGVVTHIVVDGTHYNDYVTGYYGGRMGNMKTIAANNGTQVKIVLPGKTITAETLKDCNVLVISAPAKKDGTDNAGAYVKSTFDDAFIDVVKAYVEAGGTVIVCGLADYQDGSSASDRADGTKAEQTSEQQNKLLKAIGSTMSVNDDEAYDEVRNGGQEYRLYPEIFNTDSEWTAGIITKDDVAEGETYQTYSQYSGCTINPGDGTWLVKGFDTTYSIDSDKDGRGGLKKGEETAYFLAYEKVGKGNVFVAGGVFISDFEVAAELDNIWDLPYANRTIYENILKNACAPSEDEITPIKDTRTAELNKVFVIEGYVTSGTTNPNTTFFDAIYVQDSTGGTTCFPYAAAGLAIGTKVRILGYTDAYQGDREIQIISLTVLDDTNLNTIAPKELTTKQAADYDTYGGQLVKTSGAVSNIIKSGGRVSQFDLTDSSGVKATVFIDGYIWGANGSDPVTSWLANGQTVSAVGLLYLHPEGDSEVSVPVLRVRNCDEIVKLKDAPTSGGTTTDPGTTNPGTTNPGTTGGSSGGGSSGSSSSNTNSTNTGSSNTTTTTETNPDGSTTTTVTDPETGVVTATTTQPNGSASVETTLPDGTTGTVNTNADGEVTSASASISAEAIEESASTGEAVKLPVKVPSASSSASAPEISIDVPDDAGEIKVEIPVENVTPGSVAVIVHADGTEEVVRTSYITEDGVVMNVSDDVTVKIIDNSKKFADTEGHWGESYIDFVSARELFNGVSEYDFAPEADMTRAMLMVVLARLEGVDTTVTSGKWYDAGMNWAMAKGISDGTRPDDSISREELAAMLWRYAGEPTPSTATGLADFPDAGDISSWALTAMVWAVENGIINGSDGQLLPGSNATRAQVSAMLMRYCEKIGT